MDSNTLKLVREALERIMVGGNHLALLIGADHLPHTADPLDALEHYGAGDFYEIWCCWRSIMQARQALAALDAAQMAEPVGYLYQFHERTPIYLDTRRDWAVTQPNDWTETPLYAAPQPVDGWQDIATAPRTGEWVITWSQASGLGLSRCGGDSDPAYRLDNDPWCGATHWLPHDLPALDAAQMAEPVAWVIGLPDGREFFTRNRHERLLEGVGKSEGWTETPLYAAPQPVDGWQDIATAPRDGTNVLVMYMHIETQCVFNAFYASAEDNWDEEDIGWWSYEHSEVSRIKLDGWMTPTHWQPLPRTAEGDAPMTITDEDRELFIAVNGIWPDSETAQWVRAGLAFTWEVEQIARHREAAEARIVAWLANYDPAMADAIERGEHL